MAHHTCWPLQFTLQLVKSQNKRTLLPCFVKQRQNVWIDRSVWAGVPKADRPKFGEGEWGAERHGLCTV
ncbi:hypothetical protein [Achromobacter ruhlandii]|uniref:hypothetical protein n=1 Tax=Achromobacter ruhlandii TaxID=72557 RepID=UPI003BA0A2BF